MLRSRAGTNGLRHPYMTLVPADYDPTRTWPVVEASVEVLLRWAASDDDRRPLFAAEIPIEVGG